MVHFPEELAWAWGGDATEKYRRVSEITFGDNIIVESRVGIAIMAKLKSMILSINPIEEMAPMNMVDIYINW